MFSTVSHMFVGLFLRGTLHVIGTSALTCPNGLSQISSHYDGIVCQDIFNWVFNTGDILQGSLLLMKADGTGVTLPINLESQALDEEKAYYNFTKQQVLLSQEDKLGNFVLSKLSNGEDPSYKMVREALPPIQDISSTFTFTGSRYASVDISFGSSGQDVAGLGFPTPDMFINVNDYQKYGGLIGGYLPIVVFLFTKPGDAWEFTYVPLPEPEFPDQREQRLYFRAVHLEKPSGSNPTFKVMFNDTYAYLGTYAGASQYEQMFYDTVEAQKTYWEKVFSAGKTQIVLPAGDDLNGHYILNQAYHSIVKDMITRRDFAFPSYGVYLGYGIPGNNGFQEIFTVSMPIGLEWGLFEYSFNVLENYLNHYWFDSGNVMYRGLEMAESARMLTQVALHLRYTGDWMYLRDERYVKKINGTVNMFIERYEKSLKSNYPGIATGNDEADLFGTTVRGGYTEYPYYSISAEMTAAFKLLGETLYEFGTTYNLGTVKEMGNRMNSLPAQMLADLQKSLKTSRHLVTNIDNKDIYCLPYIAGQQVCDNIPQTASPRVSEPWRTYSEMMYSGLLSDQNVDDIVTYSRLLNTSMILGMLSGTGGSCCGDQLMTFTSHGFAWGLLQKNKVVEFLLMFYTASSHSMSRGHWTAPESTSIDRTRNSVAYCSPSQGLVPLMLKWMLLFEDYLAGTVWIGKALPREWLKEGSEQVSMTGGAASYGAITFSYKSEFTSKKQITVLIDQFLSQRANLSIKVSVRAPVKTPWKKVTYGNEDYKSYNGDGEYIDVPVSKTHQMFTVFF